MKKQGGESRPDFSRSIKGSAKVIALAVAAVLLLTGCSEQERREVRETKERIAAETARQNRILQQYVADLAAETQRRKNKLEAETVRIWNEHKKEMGIVAAIVAAIAGVIGFVVHVFRRLAERQLAENTKRCAQFLKTIEADPHLRPEDRATLYRRAIEIGRRGGGPLIGPGPNAGGAS